MLSESAPGGAGDGGRPMDNGRSADHRDSRPEVASKYPQPRPWWTESGRVQQQERSRDVRRAAQAQAAAGLPQQTGSFLAAVHGGRAPRVRHQQADWRVAQGPHRTSSLRRGLAAVPFLSARKTHFMAGVVLFGQNCFRTTRNDWTTVPFFLPTAVPVVCGFRWLCDCDVGY